MFSFRQTFKLCVSILFVSLFCFNLFAQQNPEDCELNFTTFTQGGWSSPSNSVPGGIRDQYFNLVFPSGFSAGSNYTLKLTTAAAVMNFLPQGGTADKFNQNYIDPASTSAGVFAGQLVAASMNYYYNQAGYLGDDQNFKLGELVITSGVFKDKTVEELLYIANNAIGGNPTEYTYSEISNALTAINENFDNGTINKGFLTCPPTPATLGDTVWMDQNRNGILDKGETGVADITVKLFKCSGEFLRETKTSSAGFYLFENLEPGSYYVQFIMPDIYTYITLKNQGSDDNLDSDADQGTGSTGCISLNQGDNNRSLDAGLYTVYSSIGDKVWFDTDKDGLQERYEPGVGSVVVRLFDCSDNLIAVTSTDINGNYLFGSLIPGYYKLQFLLPLNHFFSPINQGGSDALDSDVDENGFTICTELAPDEHDRTWDAGVFTNIETESDLSLIKSVDNPNPQNGSTISFTVKVTNNGPDEATNVKVIDLLPDNVTFISTNTSQGVYDETNGLWTVGTLPSGAIAEMNITVQVNIPADNPAVFDLGPAKSFNVFILNDVNQPSSDTEGKMAVGGNANLANYSVGDKLPNSNGTVDVLVVGGNLNYATGAVYGGNIVYGGTTNLPTNSVSIIHGTLRQDNVIDFEAAKIYLQSLSMQLTAMTTNGTTSFNWGSLILNGTDPNLNVFSVSGSDISAANNFEINVPNGSAVLVNISGNSISWMGGLAVNGTDFKNVLFNFTESGQLNLSGIDVTGSILAPFTDVNFQAGVQHGQMIAKSLTGAGQFNLHFFMGNIPGEGKIINIAEVYFADQDDPDSSPNNGSESEDDYAKVMVHVGGNQENNWEFVGTFIAGEMILTITNDQNGSLYAGTLGGKIFKSSDNGLSWFRINNSMNAIYIWSLVITGNDIYAATELGVFKSSNGVDWFITSLAERDVRTLKVYNGALYAGVWGFGVYISTDNGSTWLAKNSGMVSVAVHSLLFNTTGDLFAATLDLGIYKSTNNGDFWNTTSMEFPYVWSLARTSGGTIFAGTYGNGLYRSTDNGNSWLKLNGLVPAYIYHIIVDSDDNIYVCSWTGGVFASSDNGNSWFGLGAPGSNVSSIMINPVDGILYAGTEDGNFYRNSSITSVNDNNNIPVEFNLMQNYPNPFNPTTIIKFDIPVAGNYIIKMYNLLGQEVKVLANGSYKPGRYSVALNASSIASGVYFYNLTGDNINLTRKMMLLK